MVDPVARETSQVAAQVFLEGAQELLGHEHLARFRGCPVNGAGFAFQDVRALLQKLEEAYGGPGGRGLALRLGRAVFRHGLKELGGQAGFRDVEYRILPSPRRVEQGLHTLAQVVGEAFQSPVAVTDVDSHWLWKMDGCPVCQGCCTEDPGCYLVVGLIQEFAAWAAGGRFYRVKETQCRAAGDPACVFCIEKKPLD